MNAQLWQIDSDKLVLRDYQEKSVQEARASIGKHKKIIVQLPTGAGKTIIATKMIQDAKNKGLRCAFVCDRLSLVDQTSAVFAKYGLTHGVIQGDHPLYDPLCSVQICSVQTLARRAYKPFDFAIIDETHSFHEAHKKICEDTPFVVGMSATPWRNGLGKYYSDLVSPVSVRNLIDGGHLVDFDVYAPDTINTNGLKTVAGDFVEKELSERADKPSITGDIVEHWSRLAKDLKTICFCVNIAHAKHLAREFNRNGVEAVQVNSFQKSGEERAMVMDSFCEGSARVICSVDILGKGFDYPQVDCVVLARPTKSPTVFVQQVGRGLRTYPKAPRCLILDHAGNTERLGFVDDMPFIPLNTNKKSKSGASKEKEKKEKEPMKCKSCDFLKPAGIPKCPACGATMEHIENIEVEEGDLQKLKRKKTEYSLTDKQMWLGGLNAYAKSKGMQKHRKGFYGWALYRYKDKFGCSPSNKLDWSYQCGITQEVDNFIIHGNIKYAKGSKKKKPLRPCHCGGKNVVEKEHDSEHKFALYCTDCGKFNKFGRLKDQK